MELLVEFDSGFNLFEVLESGDLRVGLHVQGFSGGYSESFVNNVTALIPEPGSLALVVTSGLILLRFRQWCIQQG